MDKDNIKIKALVRSYKEDGYLNIFILGQVGSGKTIFGTQLLSQICKELKIDKNIDMMYYNFNDFLISSFEVRYLENSFDKNILNNQDAFKSKINIIEIYDKKILDKFESLYYRVDILLDFGEHGIKRGTFKLGNKIGRFSNKEVFDFKDIYEKEKQAMQDNMFENVEYKDFIRKLRQQRHTRFLCLPQEPMNTKSTLERLGRLSIYKQLIQDNIDCKIVFNSHCGMGKSAIAKELHKYVEKEYVKNSFNLKKVIELFGLALIYQIFFGILLFIIGVVGFIPWMLAYGVNAIIVYEIFIKPICKEIRKQW